MLKYSNSSYLHCRTWTLQDGALGKEVAFRFADGVEHPLMPDFILLRRTDPTFLIFRTSYQARNLNLALEIGSKRTLCRAG
jgi:hypothetical protein